MFVASTRVHPHFDVIVQLQRPDTRDIRQTPPWRESAPLRRLSYACRVYQAASTFLKLLSSSCTQTLET